MPRKAYGKEKDFSSLRNEKDDVNGPEPSGKIKRNRNPCDSKIQEKKRLSVVNGNNNIIKYYENLQMGNPIQTYRSSVKLSVIDQIKAFRVAKAEGPFSRRITFIEWHPSNPRLLAVASKGGDVILWNYEEPISSAQMVEGIGAGGSVQAMKFDMKTAHKLYIVSIEGKFVLLDFETKKSEWFLNTFDFKKWYVSLDINWSSKTMVVGDNTGYLTILTTEGEIADRVRIHKTASRITHTEFSKRDSWLLCTTSNDRSIKLWDIRNFKKDKQGRAIPLHSIVHEKPINAAYFSLTDGCRLLTTDQFDKIHVYRSPLWDLETEIHHPHRQYQHLTPIRANWHPLEDLILIGRYPHKDFPNYTESELRTIDFFDADTGRLLHQHSEPGFNGIAALNKFNITGDALASGTGNRILIWKPQFKTGESIDLKKDKVMDVTQPDPPQSNPKSKSSKVDLKKRKRDDSPVKKKSKK